MRLDEFDEKRDKKLAQYKTAAAADAAKADAAGDFARGDKRFKGINTATKKQFDNDAKKSEVKEVAPPGAKAERMVRHIKQGYARDGKLTPKEKGIAFATAWKAHNAGRVEEQGVAEGSVNDYFKRRKDEEDRIAGTKAPAKRTPKQTDYEKKRKEQGVAEGSKKIPASNKPVDPKDLVVSLKDVPVKKPRGHKQYDPANEFPGVKAFKKQGVAEGSIKDVEAKIRTHDQRKADREQAGDPYVAHEIHSHNVIRKQLLDKRKRAQAEYHKKMDQQGVAEGETSTPAIYVKGGGKYPGATMAPSGWSRITDIKDEGDSYFVMVGNDGSGWNFPKDKVSPHQIKLKNGMPITAKQAFMMFNGWTPDGEQGVDEGQLDELSRDTLNAYLRKSKNRADDFHAQGEKASMEPGRKAMAKGDKYFDKRDNVLSARRGARDRLKGVFHPKEAPYGAKKADDSDAMQDMAEGHKESYIIVRTDREGKKDVFAGNFDTYEQAQKELDACLAHPLHTKHKQKFEIKRKGHKDITEMDKSQTPPGRDGGPREGPEKIARPITKDNMVNHALNALSKSIAKKDDKKKDVSEDQLDELSKDTLKDYMRAQPARIKGPAGLATTNPKKAARIVDPEKGDMRRALTKLKDPEYGQQGVAEDSIAAMRRLAGIVPQVPTVVSNGQRQYRHMPTAVQPR